MQARESATRLWSVPKTQVDQAYAELRRQIIRSELEPGAIVTEGQLSRALGMGRTPVREALVRLTQEGLILNIPRQGYQVPPITIQDVEELFGVRMVIEPAIAELAVDRVDIATLRRLDAECAFTYAAGDPEAAHHFLARNQAFHLAVAAACGNRQLADLMRSILDRSERFFFFGLRLREPTEIIGNNHEDLIAALASGNPRWARQVSMKQVREAEWLALEPLMSHGEESLRRALQSPVGVTPASIADKGLAEA